MSNVKVSNHEEYLKAVFNLVGNEYDILEEYVKTNIKLLTRHNVCGTSYYVSPNKFMMGRRCVKCYREKTIKKQQKEFDDFCKLVASSTNGEFQVVCSKYRLNGDVTIFLHNKCGREITMRKSTFINSPKCHLCISDNFIKHHKKSHETFLKEIEELYHGEYIVLGEYDGNMKHLLMKHKCGYEWMITPSNILHGYGCPECATQRKKVIFNKTQEKFEQEVERIGYGEYEVIGNYITNGKKISIRHKICGRIYDVLPGNFLRGDRCSYCHDSSNGERKIHEFFKRKKIKIIKNYSFQDCRRKNPLSFDVAFYNNGQLILIEYNGEQHYFPVEFFGGEKKFKQQQENDEIKRKYCECHNILLIIIPYWEYKNIEKILESLLFPLLEGGNK
jgi:hypothetical protein